MSIRDLFIGFILGAWFVLMLMPSCKNDNEEEGGEA